MKDIVIDKFGKIIYKDIDTDITCENIFNLFNENEDINLYELLNDEVKIDLRETKIIKILNI
jgi:hypothetical protein